MSPERRDNRYQSKKDRRRLPQPTVEEMQEAASLLPRTSPPSTSPYRKLNQGTSGVSLTTALRTTKPSCQLPTVPANVAPVLPQSSIISASSLVSQQPQPTAIAVFDQRSMSPGFLIASYPVQVVSPGGAFTRSYSPPVSLSAMLLFLFR